MLSEAAQKFFPEDGGYAARIDIAPPADAAPLSKLTAIPVDYDDVEKETARVKRRSQCSPLTLLP